MICVSVEAGEGILEEWYNISISIKIQVSVSARKSIFSPRGLRWKNGC